MPQKLFYGTFDPWMEWNINETPKGTPLREAASFEPSNAKIRRRVWPVSEFPKREYEWTRNTFYGTRYLSHCYACFAFNPLFINWLMIWPLGSLDVISHVTIGTTDGPFLLVVCWCQVTISHSCQDIEHQTFWGHELDPFGSRDVIGHVTIGTADGHFLLVIHWHHVPILHRCRDIEHQTFWVTTLTL